MAKRMTVVERIIADLDAKIERLQDTKAQIIESSVKAKHATAPKATRKPRAVPALREPA